MADEKLSASRIAERLGCDAKEVNTRLQSAGWVQRDASGSWALTSDGQKLGGTLAKGRFGQYVAWPSEILQRKELASTSAAATSESLSGEDSEASAAGIVTPTRIGDEFGFSAIKINQMLSELGWIEKGVKGWKVTEQGKKLGGIQREHFRSGVPFVVWPAALLSNRNLLLSAAEVSGQQGSQEAPLGAEVQAAPTKPSESGFREKFEAKHRATDGHFVRSKAEMLIDNWLYMAEIVHAYERKLPVEEDVYCDFYIPTGKVYIEYWGLEDDPRYRERKERKLALYQRYGFRLIELRDSDVQNLDDVLPRLLLRFGVQSY